MILFTIKKILTHCKINTIKGSSIFKINTTLNVTLCNVLIHKYKHKLKTENSSPEQFILYKFKVNSL